MAENTRRRPQDNYGDRHFGMGGGYGQGPALNYGGDDIPGPYRIAPSPEFGGRHAGPYEARHYGEFSEREPQQTPFGRHHFYDEGYFTPGRIEHALHGRDHRGKGPRNYTRSDGRVLEDVSELLTEDDVLDATNIEVAVVGGEVMLDGTVADRADKRRAEDLAYAARGVLDVRNNLRIVAGNVNTAPVAFGEEG